MSTGEILSQYQQQQRPRSAAQSGRFASQSLGKFFTAQSSAMDEQTVNSIWKGFGSYIAKQLRNGKGVSVPKFGNFTFSATNVDLAGTTNPQERDKQQREPVFLIGKDFVSGITLRAGLAHHNGSSLRPYDIKGASGIIPKVKVNYTEVAMLCSQNKDICRNGCEQLFRFLSDKARRGEAATMDIPFVGQFMIQSGIAGIAFSSDLSHDTKGVTAKNHYVNNLFASSTNRLNLQIHDQNKIKENPSVGLGGAMRLTGDAENWLKNNLNISVQDLIQRGESRQIQRIQSAKQGGANRYASQRAFDNRQQTYGNGGLTQHNKDQFDRASETHSHQNHSKRPMSAYSGASRMTNVPEVSRMKLMIIANDIFRNRPAISELVSQNKQSLRDVKSSGEIQIILRRIGINVDIGHLKALLRELGYNWNGPSCAFFDLFSSLKVMLYGSTDDEEKNQNFYQSAGADDFESISNADKNEFNINKRPQSASVQRNPQQLIDMIKDLFYSTRKSIYQIYTEARLGQLIDFDGFKKAILQYSEGRVSEQDIKVVFNHILPRGKREITFQDFEKVFNWNLPAGGDWETKTIRAIREWMFKNGLSSDTAFDKFCSSTGNIVTRRLSRVDFHKAMLAAGFKEFRAPEIDALFSLLDLNEDGELDLDEWKSRIYEDSSNPLQMLREVVISNRLTSDDLLFKMQLRIWDNALDFPQLVSALRKLDPTLSEPQLRHLAKTLKNKENKVEIPALLRNLCGQEHETVDFRNKIFREIYSEIHPHKEEQLKQLLEDADSLNDGRVEPQGLKIALKKVVKSLDEETIDRFVRFLDKDKSGKVNFMEFLSKMGEVSNRDHNPFKAVVQRLHYFIQSNNQSANSILRRLSQGRKIVDTQQPTASVTTDDFAQFLKIKVDKKRGLDELKKFSYFMDIDKDGFITEIDLITCFNNLNSDAFFKNNGEALAQSSFASEKKFFPSQNEMSNERVAELMKQIRTALINKKIAYREAFSRFDENKDGFLSFGEFSKGIDQVLTLSVPIKEKLFALMDVNKIGLVDYPNFLEFIQKTSLTVKKFNFEDNFDWENNVIVTIKAWIQNERITVEEGFKCFDKDFDGFISKDDLKYALIEILKIKPETIVPTKLDRLFRLMDFYKTNSIQLSDFQRIVSDENPYQGTGGGIRNNQSSANFNKSFGGGFAQTSTFDWKLSAIQQMGLILSKKYSNVKDSFEEASEHLQKVTFEQFKKFAEDNRALVGYNMTLPLLQKLFSELDPHKKGYVTENDWVNAFQSFKWSDQILIELKNAVQVSFSDCDSAFEFFLTFKTQQQSKQKVILYNEFEQAVQSLTSERFKRNEIQQLWKHLTEGGKINHIDKFLFRTNFDNIKYSGHSTVRALKSAPPGARTTILTQTSSSSTWEQDIFEKLRQIIRSSTKSFEEIFRELDADGNGTISQTEFRNAIRLLNLGLKSREIDKIMERIDTNQDGKIDWKEFISKFKKSDLDERLKDRAKDKMARIKELMILHMTSPNDAFRFFDESKLGKLTYQEFAKLMIKLHELTNEKCPSYPIIKDLFDTVDIRKDGIIDLNEWQQTFGNVTEGSNKLTIRATPLSMWENSREFASYGNLIARNRKLLKEQFEAVLKADGKNIQQTEVNFEQAKRAMWNLLHENFKDLNDDKLRCVLRVAELQGANAGGPGSAYDYMRMLDVYKNRHAGPQL